MWNDDRLARDVRYDDDRWCDSQYGVHVQRDNEILTFSQWNCNGIMRATDKHNQNLTILEYD